MALRPTNEHEQMQHSTQNPVAAPPNPNGSVSTLMDSSLPVIASGSDVYVRQFYRTGSGLPQRRFFPVGRV